MCCDNEAPDMSGANRAAEANAALSKESLDFYRQIYAEQAPAREKAAALNEQVSNAQLASMKQNDSISKDYWDYQKGTFRPMEEKIVADAQNYDTDARREDKASQAVADVGMQSEVARQSNVRQMQRMGVNPNSGKMLAIGNQMALSEATAKAGAANTARSNVEIQGYARKMDAANLGRNLASNQATSAGVALNAGNSAVNNAGQTMVQANQAAATMGQGFGLATSANNSAGNLYTSIGQVTNQANANDNAWMGAAGAAAGGWASGGFKMPTSDKTKKENITPISGEKALEAVEKTPVSNWDYKPGVEDGGNHTGPMAQDVQKNMGNSAAPSGKMLDLVSMNGISMAAIAALSRKVDRLAKSKGEKA